MDEISLEQVVNGVRHAMRENFRNGGSEVSEKELEAVGPTLYRATANLGLVFVSSKDFHEAKNLKKSLKAFLHDEMPSYEVRNEEEK